MGTLHAIDSMGASGVFLLIIAAGLAKRMIMSLLTIVTKRGAIVRLGILTIEIPSEGEPHKRRKR